MAIKAALAGKISAKVERPVEIKRVGRNLKNKVIESNAQETLPGVCPPKELLDRILQTEIEHERTYFQG